MSFFTYTCTYSRGVVAVGFWGLCVLWVLQIAILDFRSLILVEASCLKVIAATRFHNAATSIRPDIQISDITSPLRTNIRPDIRYHTPRSINFQFLQENQLKNCMIRCYAYEKSCNSCSSPGPCQVVPTRVLDEMSSWTENQVTKPSQRPPAHVVGADSSRPAEL